MFRALLCVGLTAAATLPGCAGERDLADAPEPVTHPANPAAAAAPPPAATETLALPDKSTATSATSPDSPDTDHVHHHAGGHAP